MVQTPPEILVQPDAFRVTREPLLLVSELQAALAVCLFDDTQAVGGLLHLRYVAPSGSGTEPVDLTDNTLSSDLLLMDSFCKELRSAGARKQSWRVSIFGHTPQQLAMEGPAATVIDLAKAYFSDARLPVECKEFRRPLGVVVRMDAREGRIWVNGTPGTAAAIRPLCSGAKAGLGLLALGPKTIIGGTRPVQTASVQNDVPSAPLYKSLYFQVLVAIAIGVLLGYFLPETAAQMKPLGDGFIKLIKMMIAPIIFCTVVTGIAGMENMKAVGKTGMLALVYFEVVSTLSLIVGLVIVN